MPADARPAPGDRFLRLRDGQLVAVTVRGRRRRRVLAEWRCAVWKDDALLRTYGQSRWVRRRRLALDA